MSAPVGKPAEIAPPRSRGVGAAVSVAAAALLALAATTEEAAVLVVVVAVQVPLFLAWIALTDATGSAGAAALALAALVAGDTVLLLDDHEDARGLAPVVGLALLAAFSHQLVRRRRRRGTTASMAAAVTAVVLVGGVACWLATHSAPYGADAVVVSAAALGAAVLGARGVDVLARRPLVVTGGTATVPGLLAGMLAGLLVGTLLGGLLDDVGSRSGLVLGLVTAAAAVGADVAVDHVGAALPVTAFRARSAVTPVASLLPLAATAPVVYIAARMLLA